MNGYLISTRDRAGLAAQLFEAAAARGVNVFPAYGLSDGTTGIVVVSSDDETGLQAAIADAGLEATPIEMIETELDNRAGTGATLFRRIADAGISLLVAVPVGMSGGRVQLALAARDADSLRRAVAG